MAVVSALKVRRGDVFLIDLDPSKGGEIRKTRPCVVVSPDVLNTHLRTFIVAPLTTGSHDYPFRVACRLQSKHGHVVLDQVRTIDRDRLLKRMGRLPEPTIARVLEILREMFAD
jgi:mRNA interferase MazF